MDYRKRFIVDDRMFNAFIAFAEKAGVKKDEAGIKRSGPLLKNQLKAYIARLKWQNEGLYPVLQDFDKTFNKGLEQLK
jgi:carboxyl-terminal processing protease